MWSFVEKALRSSTELVCCSTESPHTGRDQSGQKLWGWRCGWQKVLPRRWWTDWLTDWLVGWLAGRLTDWLTERQLKGEVLMFTGQGRSMRKWRWWWWLVGRVGAGLVLSLSSASSYNSSCPSSSSPSESSSCPSSTSSKSWRTQENVV